MAPIYPHDHVYEDCIRTILSDNVTRGSSEPVHVLPHVYLGSQRHAESLRLLRRLHVTHVLNCAAYDGHDSDEPAYPGQTPYDGLDIVYHEFFAKDTPIYNITKHFTDSFRYLDEVMRLGGVALVHCAMGINRSGAVVVAYLMVNKKMPILECVDFVSKRRRVVLSNEGFRRQLVRFARSEGFLDDLASSKYKYTEDDDSHLSLSRKLVSLCDPDRFTRGSDNGLDKMLVSATTRTSMDNRDNNHMDYRDSSRVKPPSGRCGYLMIKGNPDSSHTRNVMYHPMVTVSSVSRYDGSELRKTSKPAIMINTDGDPPRRSRSVDASRTPSMSTSLSSLHTVGRSSGGAPSLAALNRDVSSQSSGERRGRTMELSARRSLRSMSTTRLDTTGRDGGFETQQGSFERRHQGFENRHQAALSSNSSTDSDYRTRGYSYTPKSYSSRFTTDPPSSRNTGPSFYRSQSVTPIARASSISRRSPSVEQSGLSGATPSMGRRSSRASVA